MKYVAAIRSEDEDEPSRNMGLVTPLIQAGSYKL